MYKPRRILIDPKAKSAKRGEPAFIARPKGQPVYYGFPIVAGLDYKGFRLGLITEPEIAEDGEDGDAFIIAADNSRCGITYEVTGDFAVSEMLPPDEDRWGCYNVRLVYTMSTLAGQVANLQDMVDALEPAWKKWCNRAH